MQHVLCMHSHCYYVGWLDPQLIVAFTVHVYYSLEIQLRYLVTAALAAVEILFHSSGFYKLTALRLMLFISKEY